MLSVRAMPVADDRGSDPTALIEEARRRSRRRRRRRGLTAAVVLGVAALAYAANGGGRSGRVVSETSSRPFVNLQAFRHEGELAFVSRGVAWALDGGQGTLRRLPEPAGWTASNPVFSHDGHWLAYLTAASTLVSPTRVELWLARGDGRGAHVVGGLDVDDLAGWSPRADTLAVIGGSTSSTVALIGPGGSRRTVVSLSGGPSRQGVVDGAAWSPDGREIAVSTNGFSASLDGAVIRAYPVAGGAPTTWFRIGAQQSFPGTCSGCDRKQTVADLVGWWPHWGIGFWVYCCGATRNLDETPLALITRPGVGPRVLAQTLSTGTTFVAPGAGGALAVVASSNAGRVLGQGKAVEHCEATTLTCTQVPGATTWVGPDHQPCSIPTVPGSSCNLAPPAPPGRPGSGVSLDPAWSPTATLLAYVRAPVLRCVACSGTAWAAAHAIYVWNARTNATRRIGAIDGASVPTWSTDGRNLLFVRNDGLWLQPIDGGAPIEIEHPLFASDALTGPDSVDYFGQIPWTAQFTWKSP